MPRIILYYRYSMSLVYTSLTHQTLDLHLKSDGRQVVIEVFHLLLLHMCFDQWYDRPANTHLTSTSKPSSMVRQATTSCRATDFLRKRVCKGLKSTLLTLATVGIQLTNISPKKNILTYPYESFNIQYQQIFPYPFGHSIILNCKEPNKSGKHL